MEPIRSMEPTEQKRQYGYEKPKAKGMFDIWHPLMYRESELGNPLYLFWYLFGLGAIWFIWGR